MRKDIEMKYCRFTLAMLISLLAIGTAPAQWMRQIINPNSAYRVGEMTLAIHPTKPETLIAAYYEVGTPTAPAYSFSTNGGANWSSSQVAVGGYEDPSACINQQGQVFYCYAAGGVCVARKNAVSDPGWYLDIVRSGYQCDKPWVTVDNTPGYNGRIYVAWKEAGISLDSPKIMFAYSPSFGAPFTSAQQLFVGDCDCPLPVVAPNGDVYVIWMVGHDVMQNTYYIIKSTNGGASFDTATAGPDFYRGNTSDGVVGAARVPLPSVAFAPNGNLCLAFVDYIGPLNESWHIKYSQFNTSNKSWTNPILLWPDGPGIQIQPSMSVDPTGRINIAFFASTGGDTANVYLASSTDNGVTWQRQKVTDASYHMHLMAGVFDYFGSASARDAVFILYPYSDGSHVGRPCLAVHTPPPGRPALNSPTNGSTVSLTPTLTWNRAAYASSYRLQVADNSGFNNPAVDTSGISSTSYTLPALQCNTTYYWRVTASNFFGDSVSSTRSFLAYPVPVQLVSPTNCSTVSTSPTFTWNAAVNTSTYRLQVSTDVSFSSCWKDTTILSATSCLIGGLSSGANYCWRVCPIYNCQVTAWSNPWWIRTSPPPAPLLTGGMYKVEYLGELAESPWLHWTISIWQNITYGLYKYSCTSRHGCPDTVGTCIYSGYSIADTSFYDSSWVCGTDESHTVHYYVKATANATGQSVLSNKVYYAQYDASKKGVVVNDGAIPKRISLEANYPEPFNPTTIIKYSIPEPMAVKLVVYDVLSREARTLVDEVQSAGYKSVTFDAGNLPSGIYFYRLQAGGFSETRKMLLLK